MPTLSQLVAHVADRRPPAAWLAGPRAAALDRLLTLGLPTTHHEDWKYTSLQPLLGADLSLDAGPGPTPDAPILEGAMRIVLVRGRLVARTDAPAGVRVAALREVGDDPEVRAALGRIAHADDALDHLNTASFEEGVVIAIAARTTVERPLHVVHLSDGRGACHPRLLVLAGAGSRATVLEHYLGPGGAYLVNPLTEILLAPEAALVHHVLEEEGAGAFHLGSVHVRQERGASWHSHSTAVGGRIARTTLRTELLEGASARLDGLYLAGKGQVLDHHTFIDHAAPHTTSREGYRGILDAGSRGVFTGRVRVRQDAQKTDAAQQVRNLLLGDDAVANARPQLEILADDVKCSHGAAIGRLDAEAVFYLRSRGIGEREARRILTGAFASDVLDRIPDPGVRALADTLVDRWLAHHLEAS